MLHQHYCNMCLVVLQQDQLQSDNVLEDVACMLGCTRSSLHGTDLKLSLAPAEPAGAGRSLNACLLSCSCSSSLELPTC